MSNKEENYSPTQEELEEPIKLDHLPKDPEAALKRMLNRPPKKKWDFLEERKNEGSGRNKS